MHPNLFGCTKCEQHFAARQQQADHLRTTHDLKEPWLCYRCPQSFEDHVGFQEHLRDDHKPSAYCLCHKCGQHFTSEDILKRHLEHDHGRTSGSVQRKCPGCAFENDSCLGVSIHILHEHASRCSGCGRGFEMYVDYKLHATGGGCPALVKEVEERTAMLRPSPSNYAIPPASFDATRVKLEKQSSTAPIFPPPSTPSVAIPTTLRPQPPVTGTLPSDKQNTTPLPPLPDFKALGRPDLSADDFNPARTYSTHVVSEKSYRECPQQVDVRHLFHADPRMLAFGNLLRLAERFTNSDIMARANAGRPAPVFKTVQSVQSRVNAALKWTAKMNDEPLERVKEMLRTVREENGYGGRRPTKRPVQMEQSADTLPRHGLPLVAGQQHGGEHATLPFQAYRGDARLMIADYGQADWYLPKGFKTEDASSKSNILSSSPSPASTPAYIAVSGSPSNTPLSPMYTHPHSPADSVMANQVSPRTTAAQYPWQGTTSQNVEQSKVQYGDLGTREA